MPRNGLERWRGEVTAHLEDIAKRLDEFGERFEAALAAHAASDTAEFKELNKRVSTVETAHSKLSAKAAIVAGLVGAFGVAALDAAIRRLVG